VARLADRHPQNVPGDWYVDTRCIDCDVSRHYAPGLITALADGQSVVARQPASAEEETLLWRAALACPTRSIGTLERRPEPPGVFPFEVTPGVFLCGHNDRRSFGAHSWFVPGTGGGLLVDSPHWDRTVVEAVEVAGGIAHVLLTHRDDVADAHRYASHFGARVWIHDADRDAAPFATDVLTGDDATLIAPDVLAFPVPGHTRGSVLYLHREQHLFSGDTLAWFWRQGDLGAFRNATWYSWTALRASLARFVESGHSFEWICPGHGKWHGAPAEEMHDRLVRLVGHMQP
jgi:glyoxylase-like metal-dependent hydrolase (beta-lactamase superfamily II)